LKLLLDTHVFLWAISGDDRLTPSQFAAFQNPDNELWFSMASAWEVFLKISTGKLQLSGEPQTFLREQLTLNRVSLLPIRFEHVAQVARLPWHHSDPFDRLLIAQAQWEKWPVVTSDSNFRSYDLEVVA
jgi:PIN domain nuclease of toxin-antitoxin system